VVIGPGIQTAASTTPRTSWHNYKGRRWMNMLFGDGHVEYWHFPAGYDTDPNYLTPGYYDINNAWW
jgi:prepilin-type processing-associated H-X9-DG protein